MIQALLAPILKGLAVAGKATAGAAAKGAGMAAKGAGMVAKGAAGVGKGTLDSVKSMLLGSAGGGGMAPTAGTMGSGGKFNMTDMMKNMLKGGLGGGGGSESGDQQAPTAGQLTDFQQRAQMEIPGYSQVTPISQILRNVLGR